jgi:capsular exopolysaccharide synthesis family protein
MDRYQDIEENEMDIREVISIIIDNSTIFLSIILFTMLSSILYLYFSKPIYSSSVTIALDNKGGQSKLESMLSGNLFKNDKDNERLKLAKVTIESKKFIDTIIDKVDVGRELFIKSNFKKSKVDIFSDIIFDINYHDNTLYGQFFEIIPIDNKKFLLKIEKIGLSEAYNYNEEIKHTSFTLRVIKVEAKELRESKINKLLIDFDLDKSSFLRTVFDFDKSYLFRVFDRDEQSYNIIQNMKVSDISDSILKIEYKDNLPTRAKEVVTQIAKSYIEYTLINKTSELGQTIEFLDKQIIDIKSNLKNSGDELTTHQKKNGTIVMSSAGDLLENLERKEEIIDKLSLQIQEVKKFKEGIGNGVLSTVSLISSGIDTSSISSLIETYRTNSKKIEELEFQQDNISKPITSNSRINDLIIESKEKEFYIQNMFTNFTAQHPQVIEKQLELDNLKNKIYATIMANIESLKKTKAISTSNIINNMSMVENNLKNRLRVLKSNIREKKVILQELPEKYMVNENLKRKFELSGDIYTFLLQKKIEVEISKASTIANTKIIENAYISKKPIKPNRRLILILSLIVGIILGLIYVFTRSFFNSKIRVVDDISKLTNTPIYGVLPLKKRDDRFFKEAIRDIRSNLQFVLSEDKKCTNILISSTIPKEGKSTIAVSLAIMISGADKKVLLMDLDLRKPKLHRELKRSNKLGISNYLTSDLEPKDVIQEIDKNLDFFPAGSISPNPSELLMSKKLNQTILDLEREYDYIIFDSAPIGVVTDTLMILKHTDILLYIVKADEADKVYIENFNKVVKEKNIKSSGIILNGVKVYKNRTSLYNYGYI